MDPMSAISFAATVVQFVDFSSKIVSKGYGLYKSADGALPENEQLGYVVSDLKTLNARLRNVQNSGASSRDETALVKLSQQCAGIADELLFKLEKLKVPKEAKFRKWKSLRQALKSVWNKEELNKMAATLSDFRSQLELHILVSLRETHDIFAIQQSEQFKTLDARQQEIIELLQTNSNPFTDVLKAQGVLISTLSRETRDHVTKEHEHTRAEIIKAINDSKSSHQITSIEVHTSSKETADPDAKIRLMVEEAILDSLKFPSMRERYDGIEDAHSKTFDWVFEPPDAASQPWDDFSKWLSHGDQIYWINGKAGSGKSTLMRYVYEHERTSQLLREWASSAGGLIKAGFFFWKSGVPDQASQSGLLRSLLYSLLAQKRDALPLIFPEEWQKLEARAKVGANDRLVLEKEEQWSVRQLRTALESFFRLELHSRVCIFVDGLDEYSGDLPETIHLFKKLASKDVKFCLSSRPWNEFGAFKSFPKLRLQDLTYNDIRRYVEEKFKDDENMAEFSEQTPLEAQRFIEEIVAKADGVFLWVKLVVRSLLNGMSNGDRIVVLQKRLDELPSDLKKLYQHMFDTISPRYFVEGCQIFQIMQAMQNLRLLPASSLLSAPPLCALILSFALEETEATIIDHPYAPLQLAQKAHRVEGVEKRLKVCCAGLLEFPINQRAMSETTLVPHQDHRNKVIRYIHRTALEFLSEPVVWKKILHATSAMQHIVFNANVSLLKSFILRIKTSSMINEGQGTTQWGSVVFPPMALPYYAEKEGDLPSIALIDELSKVLAQVRPAFEPELSRGGYEELWPTDFLILAVRFQLFHYLIVKFALPCWIPRSPLGHSYLRYALLDLARKNATITASESIIALLLPYSSASDIQEGWTVALEINLNRYEEGQELQSTDEAHMWIAIWRLFLKHGADPRMNVTISTAYRDPEDWREEKSETYSAKEVVALLGTKLPNEVAELLELMKEKKRSTKRAPLFRKFRRVKEPPPPPLPDLSIYPERTWWMEY